MYGQYHCPQSFLLFAGVCLLLRTREDFIFFSLSESNQNVQFSIPTLDPVTSGILAESGQMPTKGSYNSLQPLWPAELQLPGARRESVGSNSYFFHRVNYLLC